MFTLRCPAGANKKATDTAFILLKVTKSIQMQLQGYQQQFSIHFEARTPSGRKIHFSTPCTIRCIVFCIIREVRT